MPKITITRFKDGRQVARFRDSAGAWVRTSASVSGDWKGRLEFQDGTAIAAYKVSGTLGEYSGPSWTRAPQMRELGEYWIRLQRAQCAAGLGADGQTMKPLQGAGGGKVVFLQRVDGKAQFGRTQGYAEQKRRMGLAPIRDLWGPGKGGHMLDDLRINYLDDQRVQVGITRTLSRQKARANERRARWWGLGPAAAKMFLQRQAEVLGWGAAETLYAYGVIGAQALLRVRGALRRLAA